MRVYKSPAQLKPSNMQKKSSINFVKNIAAPKHTKTPNVFNSNSNAHSPDNNPSKSIHNSNIIYEKYQTINQNSKETCSIQVVIHRSQISGKKTKQIKSSIISPQPIRCLFSYNTQTEVKQFIGFIHAQIQNNMVYIKTDNIYVDYILGIKEFKIKHLIEIINEENLHNENLLHEKKTELEVHCCEYDEIDSSNHLRNFEIIKCVGSGGFSKVFLVRGFGKLMAMKVINKEFIVSNEKANIINNEKTILSICSQHPFITKLETSFQTSNFLIFVMEFCNGGELFNLLRKVRRMKEEDAKFYFVQTLCAIVYLHKKGIVYRDIKPENIIIDYEGHVRLADYGLSKIMEENRESKTYSFCGSAEYMAPQMLLKKGHSFQIDFYCLGALLYELVIGLPPYYSRNQNELFSNIIHNQLEFPPHLPLSNQLKNFLSSLLEKEVQQRYSTIQQILDDPWMQNINLEHVLQKRLKPPFQTDMLAYNFDDSDFVEQERQMLLKLSQQKNLQKFQDMKFPDFFYESKEISDLKSVIKNSKQQGMFIRSLNQRVGQFIAESYICHSRKVSNSGSMIMMGHHSREPSINRLDHSGINKLEYSGINKVDHSGINSIPTSSQITRRGETNNIFPEQQSNHSKIVFYSSNRAQKCHLSSVRSLQHISTSKSSLANNRSQERINSISKDPSNQQLPFTNIYTTHKQAFHPFGIKLTTPTSTLISSSQHQIRSPNYYSVQKSPSRGNGIRLDIHDLKIKNQRNFSVERPRQNFSVNNLTIGGTPNNSNGSMTYLKHAFSAYELKKSYIDGLREKNLSTKVKKSSFKNGQKISISMLNNLHYRT